MNLQLRIIADGLQNSAILKHIPLIQIVAVATPLFVSLGQIELEPADLVEHRAHVLVLQLADGEPMVQEAVPKSQILPDVDLLAKHTTMFKLGLAFDEHRIEATRGDLDVPLVLHEEVQAAEGLWDSHRTLRIIVEPEVRDAWHQANKSLLGTDDLLHETEVVLEGSLADANPLVRHYWRLLHLRAAFHHLCHLGDRDHAEATGIDSSHAASELLHMTELIGLDKNDASCVLRLENLHHHERMALIEVINQLVRETHD